MVQIEAMREPGAPARDAPRAGFQDLTPGGARQRRAGEVFDVAR